MSGFMRQRIPDRRISIGKRALCGGGGVNVNGAEQLFFFFLFFFSFFFLSILTAYQDNIALATTTIYVSYQKMYPRL